MEQRHSPCRDTSSWTDSNDFDKREREVADILVEFYHQLNEYARPQVSVWGAKRKRSVLDETYSPTQEATFPNNSEPLRVQPLRSVPSNSYTNTTMKINYECLRAQPLRTIIPSNDGLFSTGATNLVCHREPNSLVLHLKPMKKPNNKKLKMRLEEEVADMMKTKDDLSESINKVKLHLKGLKELNMKLKARKQEPFLYKGNSNSGEHLSLSLKVMEPAATEPRKLIIKETTNTIAHQTISVVNHSCTNQQHLGN